MKIELHHRLLALVLLLKVVVIYSLILFGFNNYVFFQAIYEHNFLYPPDDPISLRSAFLTWDARFYYYLAENGYGHPASLAFYPLYPFLMAVVGVVSGVPLSGFIISNLAFCAGIFLLFDLVARLFTMRAAWLTVLVLLTYPASFFFSMVYTEALYFLLAVLAFWYLERERFGLAAFCALLMGLTRPVGILMVVPLDQVLFIRGGMASLKVARNYVYAALPVLGFALTHLIVFLFTGDWGGSFRAQGLFSADNSILNLFRPIDWLQRNFLNIELTTYGYYNGLIDRLAFLGFIPLLYGTWRWLRLEYFWYALLGGMIPALSGMFMSYTRLLLVCFPLFVIAGVFLDRVLAARGIARVSGIVGGALVLLALGALQVDFIVRYSLNFWVA